MEPTPRERASVQACALLTYVLPAMGRTLPQAIKRAAATSYGA